MRKTFLSAGVAAIILVTGCATVQEKMAMATDADSGPGVRIISPADGATVSSPVNISFGLNGMGVAPAGTDMENTGHHHLIINAPLPDMSLPIPANENYKHFGGGQTEVSLDLEPGTHTLQLLMGNFIHIPHAEPVYSRQISITVE